MHWTTEQNTQRIVESLMLAAQAGASLCPFPELAVTGFHRNIREQAALALVTSVLRRVQGTGRELGIGCALGTPTFADDGTVLNSYLLINRQGEVVTETAKDGLTPAEATFFARGRTRPVAQFEGRSCETVIGQEVENLDAFDAQLAGRDLALVFWPGLVSPVEGAADPLALGTEVVALARRFGAYVVQSNWPNALNRPQASQLGASRVVDPSGDVCPHLLSDQAGVGIVTLGERDFDWTPLPA